MKTNASIPLEGQVTGRHYRTGECLTVHWRDGRVTAREPAPEVAGETPWLAPALVDLQVNGYAGIDFQQDTLEPGDLVSAAEALRQDGCARFLVTLITAEWNQLLGRLERLRKLRAANPFLTSAILGWHIEGPFLSAEPGFHGAHDPALMFDPEPRHLHELRAAAGADPLLLTLAPERVTAENIGLARSLGIRVSLGHTNVSTELLERVVTAGAESFTHLGNGCSASLNRHDNIFWRVLDSNLPRISLIPDGVHVPAPLFRTFHRAARADVFYVSDAMAAAAAPPGRYRLGEWLLEVGADGVVRRPGSPYLAGSSLRPIQGVLRAAAMLRCGWPETWFRFSETPARFLGVPTGMEIGDPLRLCVIEPRGIELQVRTFAPLFSSPGVL